MKKKNKETSFSWLFLQLFFCIFVLSYISLSASKPFQKPMQVECINFQ